MIADLDTLLVALYVESTDRIMKRRKSNCLDRVPVIDEKELFFLESER